MAMYACMCQLKTEVATQTEFQTRPYFYGDIVEFLYDHGRKGFYLDDTTHWRKLI